MRNKLGKLVLTMFLVIFGSQYIVFAQESTSDLRKEIDELKQEQKATREDIRMIKNLLLQGQKPVQRPAPPQVNVHDVEFELGNNPEKGSKSAPLVLVEFSDYQCSFCARHSKQTYPEIYNQYINTGKLRYVFVDKPLPSHNMANDMAMAAHCAAGQGKFSEMHEGMMDSPEYINDLTILASSFDIDMHKFKSCMETKKYADKIASNLSLAMKLHISSVPGFVIASVNPDDPQKVTGISFIRGAAPFTVFQQEIDQALNSLSEN